MKYVTLVALIFGGSMSLSAESITSFNPIIQVAGPDMLSDLKNLPKPNLSIGESYVEYLRLKNTFKPDFHFNLDISVITPEFVPGLRMFRGSLADNHNAVVDGAIIIIDRRDFVIWDGKFYARPYDETEHALDDSGHNREINGLKLYGMKYWELFHKTYMVEMEKDKNIRKDLRTIEEQLKKVGREDFYDLGEALRKYFFAAPSETRLSQVAAALLLYLNGETAQGKVKWVKDLPRQSHPQKWIFQSKIKPHAVKTKTSSTKGELHGFAIIESESSQFFEVELLVTPKEFRIRRHQLGWVREPPRG